MKGGSLPGVVWRMSGGPLPGDGVHRHSKPSWVSVPDGRAVPRDNQVKSGFVARARNGRAAEQEALGRFPLPVPLVLAGEGPDGIGGALRIAVLFDQARGDRFAHRFVDRGRMLAAQAERFEEPLADAGDINPEFAHAIIDDGLADGWMRGRLVLDDFQRPDARALLAPGAQEEPPVRRRPQQDRARRREVGLRVEVVGDADGMPEDGGVDVVASVDIDTPHELDELARLGHVVAAGFIDGFADQVKGHSNLPVLQVREGCHFSKQRASIFSNLPVP